MMEILFLFSGIFCFLELSVLLVLRYKVCSFAISLEDLKRINGKFLFFTVINEKSFDWLKTLICRSSTLRTKLTTL